MQQKKIILKSQWNVDGFENGIVIQLLSVRSYSQSTSSITGKRHQIINVFCFLLVASLQTVFALNHSLYGLSLVSIELLGYRKGRRNISQSAQSSKPQMETQQGSAYWNCSTSLVVVNSTKVAWWHGIISARLTASTRPQARAPVGATATETIETFA